MKIPIVFAFDDNYALPASIAIKSLLDSKNETTEYEVIVFHGGLKSTTIKKMEEICSIRWIKVTSDLLTSVPIGWSGIETYYRLLIADLLPEYDKVLWSDVDVLFKGDLTDVYAKDIQEADWGGIIAEKQDETNGIHPHYFENKKPYIYMPGFMVVNTKLWRKKKIWNHFLDIIEKYGNNLKFFDLDILNLAADKIYSIPFEYCVLENIFDNEDITNAKEYLWLERAHGKEVLIKAKQKPVIIHYAGKSPKIWKRKYSEIPQYYWRYIENSPFYKKEQYFYTLNSTLKLIFLYVFIKLCPIKNWRKKLKQTIKDIKG